MREVRLLAVVSTLALGAGLAAAQAPAVAPKMVNGDPAPKAAVEPGKQDAALQAIYLADEKWRESQRGAGDMRHYDKVQPMLRSVDPATQEKAYEHWKSVKAQIDKLGEGELSEPERVNLMVYRGQIEALEDSQKFKEWEKPVTSMAAFWTGTEVAGERPFRNEQDYLNYMTWLADIPRYFDENITNMKAGVKRGYTPPKVTLNGRDGMISPIANAKSADATPYWKPFVHMPRSVNEAEQARLRAEAKKLIEGTVIPEYQKLLSFWNADYYPHAVTSTAAEDLPDGQGLLQGADQAFTQPPR